MKIFIIIVAILIILLSIAGCAGSLTPEQAAVIQNGFNQHYQMQRDIYNRQPVIIQSQPSNYWQEQAARKRYFQGW